jgi:hypothetical protein
MVLPVDQLLVCPPPLPSSWASSRHLLLLPLRAVITITSSAQRSVRALRSPAPRPFLPPTAAVPAVTPPPPPAYRRRLTALRIADSSTNNNTVSGSSRPAIRRSRSRPWSVPIVLRPATGPLFRPTSPSSQPRPLHPLHA